MKKIFSLACGLALTVVMPAWEVAAVSSDDIIHPTTSERTRNSFKPNDMSAINWVETLLDTMQSEEMPEGHTPQQFLGQVAFTLGGGYGFENREATLKETCIILKAIRALRAQLPDQDVLTLFSIKNSERTAAETEHLATVIALYCAQEDGNTLVETERDESLAAEADPSSSSASEITASWQRLSSEDLPTPVTGEQNRWNRLPQDVRERLDAFGTAEWEHFFTLMNTPENSAGTLGFRGLGATTTPRPPLPNNDSLEADGAGSNTPSVNLSSSPEGSSEDDGARGEKPSAPSTPVFDRIRNFTGAAAHYRWHVGAALLACILYNRQAWAADSFYEWVRWLQGAFHA